MLQNGRKEAFLCYMITFGRITWILAFEPAPTRRAFSQKSITFEQSFPEGLYASKRSGVLTVFPSTNAGRHLTCNPIMSLP